MQNIIMAGLQSAALYYQLQQAEVTKARCSMHFN